METNESLTFLHYVHCINYRRAEVFISIFIITIFSSRKYLVQFYRYRCDSCVRLQSYLLHITTFVTYAPFVVSIKSTKRILENSEIAVVLQILHFLGRVYKIVVLSK